jgi:hypothetical protein
MIYSKIFVYQFISHSGNFAPGNFVVFIFYVFRNFFTCLTNYFNCSNNSKDRFFILYKNRLIYSRNKTHSAFTITDHIIKINNWISFSHTLTACGRI